MRLVCAEMGGVMRKRPKEIGSHAYCAPRKEPVADGVMEKMELSFTCQHANNGNVSLDWLALPCVAVIE